MNARKANSALSILVLALALGACRSSEGQKSQEPEPEETATVVDNAEPAPAPAGPIPEPVSQERIQAVLNPAKVDAYQGPFGIVEGTIRIEGAEAPKRDVAIPQGCGDALATYTKLFREGTGRTLADALVTVTEYEGFVEPKREAKTVAIRGCAYETRTLALSFGERIEVSNRDAKISYLPQLLGGRHPVEMVAVPRGDAVKLYPTEVGRYILSDGMARKWMHADVFVLKYPTHDVTGLDGKFRIENVPVGKVRVTAYLPAIDESVDTEVEVKEGEPTVVELTLKYEEKK